MKTLKHNIMKLDQVKICSLPANWPRDAPIINHIYINTYIYLFIYDMCSYVNSNLKILVICAYLTERLCVKIFFRPIYFDYGNWKKSPWK